MEGTKKACPLVPCGLSSYHPFGILLPLSNTVKRHRPEIPRMQHIRLELPAAPVCSPTPACSAEDPKPLGFALCLEEPVLTGPSSPLPDCCLSLFSLALDICSPWAPRENTPTQRIVTSPAEYFSCKGDCVAHFSPRRLGRGRHIQVPREEGRPESAKLHQGNGIHLLGESDLSFLVYHRPSALLSAMIIKYQFDIKNHHGDKPWDVSIRDFLD